MLLLYSFLIFKQQIWRLVLFHLGICERQDPKGFSLIPFPLSFEFIDVVIELIKNIPAWMGRHLLDGGENRRYFGLESQPLIRGQMRYHIGSGHIGVTMKSKLYHLLEHRAKECQYFSFL